VDWKPFRYFILEYVAMEGFVPFPTPMLVSLETEPLPDGRTRVRLLCKPRGRNVVKRILMVMMRKQIERQGNAELERLNTLLRADRQTAPAATSA
jgi:hypothetical protein